MRSAVRILGMSLSLFLLACFAAPSSAQFGGLKDKLKDKAKQKATEKAEQVIDGEDKKAAADSAETPETKGEPVNAQETKQAGDGKVSGTAAAEDMTLYSKYDFVPGDKVIFFDDLASEEMGEFPSRWSLEHGVFEIAKQHGQKWIWCTNRGMIYPKVTPGPLPEKYTVELDFYANQKNDGWLEIHWFNAANENIGILSLAYDNMTSLHILGKELASKNLPRLSVGRHTMRVMATKTTMKCYIDQVRIANVPAVEGFDPMRIGVRVDPYFENNDPMLIGAFRYAAGGKTLQQQLDEAGRIVTHGILFDSGSDRIKAESFKTLADIGGLLTDNPALRLSIEGHTDSDGADDANMTLSQKRAASVRTYLMDNYKVDGSRLEAKGWGESKSIDANTTAEGKANNRRVELVKL